MKFPSYFSISLHGNTTAPVKFILDFDGTPVAEKEFDQSSITLRHDFDDIGDQTHCIKLIMIGKQGNDDIHEFLATIESVELDYLNITDFYSTVGLPYWHTGNGNHELKKDRLHKSMGCDGTIEFSFSSPVYKWFPVITTPNHGY